MKIAVEDDGHQNNFNLLVSIYDILHHTLRMIQGELQFLHCKSKWMRDNGKTLICQGIHQQIPSHHEGKDINNIIGDLFFPLEEDVEVVTDFIPIVISPNNGTA